MPEISRFLGIIISMYFDEHNPPHFHAQYGESKAQILIKDLIVKQGELPSRVLPNLLLAASRAFRRLEKMLKPRLFYPEFPGAFQRVSGVLIVLCGLLLLLPLPVPFSNAFPAFTIILLAAAGLERDGAVFVACCVQFALCLGFFAALCLGGTEVWQRIFN